MHDTLKILVIEDESTDFVGPCLLFHHLGHDVTVCFDGGEALKEITTSHFDLIILDWNLPYISGAEFLNLLQRGTLKPKHKLRVVLHSGETLQLEQFNNNDSFEVVEIWQKPLLVSQLSKRFNKLCARIWRTL